MTLQKYEPLPFEHLIQEEYWYICGSVIRMRSEEQIPKFSALFSQVMTTIEMDAKNHYVRQAILKKEYEKYNQTPDQFSRYVYGNPDRNFDIQLPVTEKEMVKNIMNYLQQRYCCFELDGQIINNPYGREVW